MCRNDFQSNKKTTTCTCEIENDITIDDIFISPGEEEVIEIMTRVETNTSCQSPDYSWTSWYSATNDNTNDYETLLDHRNLNKYVSFWFFFKYIYPISFITNLSVCDFPAHIEAREVETKISWYGSDAILVHDSKSNSATFPNSINKNPVWTHGISKDFGYVTSRM